MTQGKLRQPLNDPCWLFLPFLQKLIRLLNTINKAIRPFAFLGPAAFFAFLVLFGLFAFSLFAF